MLSQLNLGTFLNIIFESQKVQNKSEAVTKLMHDYGSIIDLSLNYQINASSIKLKKIDEASTESDEAEYKNTVKSIETSIESKFLSIDIIRLILNHFIKEGITGSLKNLEFHKLCNLNLNRNQRRRQRRRID